jgi:hypothetical protein
MPGSNARLECRQTDTADDTCSGLLGTLALGTLLGISGPLCCPFDVRLT